MVKKLLAGEVEEQCEFLYNLGLDKMKGGNFAGAMYAFKEVAKHHPDYRNVSGLLKEVKERKSQQRQLILVGLGAGALFMTVGRLVGVSQDLALILLGTLGLVCGYVAYSWTRFGGLTSPFGRPLP